MRSRRTPLKAAVAGILALGLASSGAFAQGSPCSPKSKNPCAAKAKNPCAAKKKPCAAANPCAAKSPCGANPCAAKKK